MFQLWPHGEAQTPEMEHYPGLFTGEYMDDWRQKTVGWEVPVEEPMQCECGIVEFVVTIEADSIISIQLNVQNRSVVVLQE
jgi:hypothetical protein